MKRSTLPFSIAFVLAGVLGGCQRQDPDALLASAEAHLAQRDVKAAVIQLKNVLQARPDSARARFLLGRTLLEAGDAVAAVVELRKAAALKATDTDVPLAQALLRAGETRRVTEEFAAVSRLPDARAEAALRTTVASAYEAEGRVAEAEAALDAALRAVPGFVPARIARARMVAGGGDLPTARQLAERVLADAPQDAEAWRLEADLRLVAAADPAGAIAAYRRALGLQPDLAAAHAGALWALLAQGDLAAARSQWQAMQKALPQHPETRYFQAELALRSGDAKQARELVQKLLAVAPDDVRLLQLGGSVELQNGSLEQAERLFSQALQAAPGNAPVRRLLARTRLRSGDASRALAVLAPLVGADATADPRALSLAAEAQLRLGHRSEADALLLRAAELDPKDAGSRAALALAGLSKGSADAALAQLRDIAASDAESGTVADVAVIGAALQRRDLDAASLAIEELQRKRPGEALGAILQGRVALARGDAAAARQSFERALRIDPLGVAAATSLASLDMAEHEPQRAIDRFEPILRENPKNTEALLAVAALRGEAGAKAAEVTALIVAAVQAAGPLEPAPRLALVDHHLRSHDFPAALAAARDGLAAMPGSVPLLDALGRAQAASGDLDAASATFDQLVALEPGTPQPHVRLAEIDVQRQQVDAAAQHLRRALAVAPSALSVQRTLIALETQAGHLREALGVARSVQSQRPSDAVGFVFEGDIEASQKHWDAAAAAYSAGLQRVPATEVAVKLHALLLAADRPAEAATFADDWMAKAPKDAAFLFYVGDAALRQQNLALAESSYRRVAQLSPEHAVALNNVAWVLMQRDRPGALAFAEQANRLRPDQPVFMDTLAAALAHDKQIGKALDVQRRAVALDPRSDPLRMNLAKIYLQAGDKAQARVELERLAKLGNGFAERAQVDRLLQAL